MTRYLIKKVTALFVEGTYLTPSFIRDDCDLGFVTLEIVFQRRKKPSQVGCLDNIGWLHQEIHGDAGLLLCQDGKQSTRLG